jgi:large subunit ribosomal protein L10
MTPGRTERATAVAELRDLIRGAGGLVFMNAQALDSVETHELRKAIRPTGARLKVVKNRLMKIACKEEAVDGCGDWLVQNTAVAFLGADPVAAIKAVSTFAGEHDKLKVKGGWMDRKPLQQGDLKALASLPGRRELLTMTAVIMKAPLARGARDFKEVLAKLARAMHAAAKKAPQA